MRPEYIETLNRLGAKERESLFSILATTKSILQEGKTENVEEEKKRLKTEYLNHVRQEWRFFTRMYGGEDVVWADEGLVEILLDKIQKDPDKKEYQLTGTIFATKNKERVPEEK